MANFSIRINSFYPSRNLILVILVLILSTVLIIVPTCFETPFGANVQRARACVLEVDNQDIQTFGIMTAGEQHLEVEILNGPYKGQRVEATNILIGKMETDKMFQKGDSVFLVLDTIEEDRVVSATAYDHYRLNIELFLVILFSIFLIGFAGTAGMRALLSFAFAILLLWQVLFPAILVGRDPIVISLIVVIVLTAVTLFLVAGVNKIALVALIGSILGIILTIGLSFLLLPPFHLHGAVQPFTETLLYTGFEHLNLTRIFLAAIFIGASGAVLDVAIDVATSMSEVIEKRPDLSFHRLLASGFVVGRNMTSTMVTTLLMAYASGYMALMMVFMAQGTPPLHLLNTNYVAAEVLKTVVGSFGLVTVAPFTAFVGAIIYTKWKPSMETFKPMFENPLKKDMVFKVDASRCELRIGDLVDEETIIGEDFETGEILKAGLRGRVQSIGFDAGDHALIITVRLRVAN
jgi:uncharacterized membrane protein